MHWLVPTVPVAAQGITTGIFSRHSALRDVVSGEIRHGRSWNWLRWRYVELKFHPNLKVGFVLTCFYYRGLVKVLFCVLRANSFPYTGYLGPNICQVSLGASKKGVGPMGATPGGGTQVHHGRVGSAGLCDLKILHPWRRLKKGVKILQWPPNARKGGSIFYISMKSLQKKGGKKSTILKNIGVKIREVWKWGSKFYMLKNRGQNSTMLEKRGVNILHPTPKVEVKILHRLKKGGQKGRAYPLPKI